jgi:hypothetical protein
MARTCLGVVADAASAAAIALRGRCGSTAGHRGDDAAAVLLDGCCDTVAFHAASAPCVAGWVPAGKPVLAAGAAHPVWRLR